MSREEKLVEMVFVLEELDCSGEIWDKDNDLTWVKVAKLLLDASEGTKDGQRRRRTKDLEAPVRG